MHHITKLEKIILDSEKRIEDLELSLIGVENKIHEMEMVSIVDAQKNEMEKLMQELASSRMAIKYESEKTMVMMEQRMQDLASRVDMKYESVSEKTTLVYEPVCEPCFPWIELGVFLVLFYYAFKLWLFLVF
jgi:hypothetical protein